jgi:tetratricopeptide (TPR) repeat protein
MGHREAAEKFLKQGIEIAKSPDQKVRDHAYQLVVSACYADPTWWEAFYNNGNVAADFEKREAAIAAYRRALECETTPHQRAPLLTNLGWKLSEIGKLTEGAAMLHAAIEQNPRLGLPWLHLSSIHTALDQTTTAVECARKAKPLLIEEGKENLADFALAFALLFDRQLAAGFKAFESRFAERLPQFLHYPYPKWKGEKGKTVFLVADQGLGDTLSFARFVPLAARRAGYIHAVVQRELMRTFRYAFRQFDNINWLPQPCNFPQADAWTTFVSLPYALGLSDDQIRQAPNIEVLPQRVPNEWKVPDRKLHIGIAWSGAAQNDIDRHRAIPLVQFLDLYRVPGIQLYSLQMDGRRMDIHHTGSAALIRDLSGYIEDVAGTFAILQHLDMVVTIESALGHICTMVNKKCWIPYSFLGRDHRIGATGEDRLWSPAHRIFRQGPDLQWQPVFDKMVEALKEEVDAR